MADSTMVAVATHMPIDPQIRVQSLEQKSKLLGDYKRANKDRKKALGGPAYLKQLEADIRRLESDAGVCVDGNNVQRTSDGAQSANAAQPTQGEPTADTQPAGSRTAGSREHIIDVADGGNRPDVTMEDQTSSIEKLLEVLPYRALENFKNAWNDPAKSSRMQAASERLVETWHALQVAAHAACASLRIAIKDPAWPGPLPQGTLPTVVQVNTTARWLKERLPEFETAHMQVTPGAKPLYFVYDYKTGKEVELTEAMAYEARTDPKAWPGSIEHGQELVLRILTNRGKNQKCISCGIGACGQSASKKGAGLRGDGPDFLTKCRCPIDTALIEYWMYKITATHPQVPERGKPGEESEFPLSDFVLNPVALRVIGAAIESASGLAPDNAMFGSPDERVQHTMMWALDQLCGMERKFYPDCRLYRKVKALAVRVIKEIEDLDKADMEN